MLKTSANDLVEGATRIRGEGMLKIRDAGNDRFWLWIQPVGCIQETEITLGL
ncbi:hypothetical protein PS639_05845 [Pseudomonas fluorescens]|nr:hypothetical protein PS639_05845 [Pseudomonas fluorescens]